MAKKPPPGAAWAPAHYGLRQIAAIQALAKGEATADQQTHALDWLVHEVCKTYDQSFRPDSERETAFAEGKRYVGLTIVKATKLNTANLRSEHERHDRES